MTARSVIIIDHDQLFAAALSALLERDGFVVQGSFSEEAAASAAMAAGLEPQLLIVDPAGMSGRGMQMASRTDMLRQLRVMAPESALVVLSEDVSEEAVRDSLATESDGHLGKGMEPAALRHALSLISLGQCVYPPGAFALLGGGPSAVHGSLQDISPRERQILACLLAGLSNKAIAIRLQVTESTVKMHFKNVLRKIRAANRTQAAVWALEHGIRPMG